MPTYVRFLGSTLPASVGKDGPDGARLSDGRAGHVSFGPFVTLDPGSYVAGFYVRKQPEAEVGRIEMDVVNERHEVLAHKTASTTAMFERTPSLVATDFEVVGAATGVEVRLYVHESVMVEVDELVIFSKRTRSWGGT